jgi:hypothetical protein
MAADHLRRYEHAPVLGPDGEVTVGEGRRPGRRGTARMEGMGPAELRAEWERLHDEADLTPDELQLRFGDPPHEYLLGGPSADDPGLSVPLPGKFSLPDYVDMDWREYSRGEQGETDGGDSGVQLYVRLSNQRTQAARRCGDPSVLSELPYNGEQVVLARNSVARLRDGEHAQDLRLPLGSPARATVVRLERGPGRRATARVWLEFDA